MSSAVESHFGPGRPSYGAHHYGTIAVPSASLPAIGSVAMSAAEFVRPHPKTSNR